MRDGTRRAGSAAREPRLAVGRRRRERRGEHLVHGIDTLILPKRNEKDLEDVPASVRDRLRFHFVDAMDEVLAAALAPPSADREARFASG